MKITDVEAIHLRLPEVAEIADGTQDVLIVKVHTDAGLVGVGEVTSQSYVCKAIVEAVDLAHVEAARRAAGDAVDLMVDAGLCWDAATALRRAQLLAPYRVAWLEEPLAQDDLAGYATLCPAAGLPIAAGEGGVTHW